MTALTPLAAGWAESCGGAVDEGPPIAAGRAPMPPVSGADLLPATAAALVLRRALKPPARAVEKALVCYGGDVSRLVDLARRRIVFAGAAGLARCVELVAAASDAGVRVVRVKDGLSCDSDAWPTAGYRVRGAAARRRELHSAPMAQSRPICTHTHVHAGNEGQRREERRVGGGGWGIEGEKWEGGTAWLALFFGCLWLQSAWRLLFAPRKWPASVFRA